MILKKKEFFLFILLILLQSCSGGRIGNFLESSFNDSEEISRDKDLQINLLNKKIVVSANKEIEDTNNKKIKKVLENKKDIDLKKEKKEINDIKNKKIKKVVKSKNVVDNKKDINLEIIPKPKNKKIRNSSKKRNIELQSYKIIFILKDVDPKDPMEELSSILSNFEVNFEIEKIERIFDSENKSMDKN